MSSHDVRLVHWSHLFVLFLLLECKTDRIMLRLAASSRWVIVLSFLRVFMRGSLCLFCDITFTAITVTSEFGKLIRFQSVEKYTKLENQNL